MIRLLIGLSIIIYVWLIYGSILLKKEDDYKESNQGVSVVIPVYNESYDDLRRCVKSIVEAKGKKQIILVNNNNKKPEILDGFRKILDEFKEVNFVNEFRQGKRFAHVKGVSIAKYDILMFVDSDTVIDNNAVLEIQKPFQNKDVGAVSGQVVLLNNNDSWFTRSIDAMFWTSNNIFRKFSGNLGFMQVSPGAISAYRKELILKLEDKYINQIFMGSHCAISDDRFLTMRVQTYYGKKVVYYDKALAYTTMPNNVFKFWKVLERWKRGVIREVLIFWKEPKKKAKKLFLDTQFNFIMMNVMMVFKILLIIDLILNFTWMHVISVLGWFVLMSVFYNGLMLSYKPKHFKYKLLYSFMYEFFLSFTYFNALWNLRDQGSWKTR